MIGGLLKSVSGAALFAAVGIFAVGGVPAAKAADLGGDCCADLEERVAELEATTARKGNRRVSLTISGQVATHVMFWNDDATDGAYVLDNTAAVGGSGFTFAGNAKINPNVTAGFDLALGVASGSRSAGGAAEVNQLDDDGTEKGDTSIAVLRANWYLDHKQLGRLTVGRINTASAGASSVDLGGAGVIANANIGYWQRGFFLADEGGLLNGKWTTALGGGTVNGSGLSRANGVMYSTPTFGGFSLSASAGEDDYWDAALRYAGEFSGFRIAGAVAYTHNVGGLGDFSDGPPANTREPDVWKGSASILHVGTGLFVTGAYVTQDNDNGTPDTSLWYVQAGLAKNWFGIGNTVLYGEYSRVNDGINCGAGNCQDFGGNAGDVINSSEATVWGLGVVQHIDAAAMELYLSYRRYSAEVTSPAGNLISGTESFNDFDAVVSGARIRF
jgi:hypothetical protein